MLSNMRETLNQVALELKKYYFNLLNVIMMYARIIANFIIVLAKVPPRLNMCLLSRTLGHDAFKDWEFLIGIDLALLSHLASGSLMTTFPSPPSWPPPRP